MNVLRKIFNFIFNPFNSVSFGKSTEKMVDFFTKHPALIFVTALCVSALTLLIGHYFF